MESINPYQSPSADVSAQPVSGGYDTTSPFSPKGRFGRLSYLAWVALLYFPLWIISVLTSAAAPGSAGGSAQGMQPMSVVMGVIMVIYIIPMTVAMWLFAIRRLHDFNTSGWWSLLFLLPIVNLIFGLVLLLRRGDEGSNDFGPVRITRGWEQVLGYIGVVMLVIALIGIVAAIAIPMFVAAR